MKKFHTSIKVIAFSISLAGVVNSNVSAMETLADSGITTLLRDAGDTLAKKTQPSKTSYVSMPTNQHTPKDNSLAIQGSQESKDCNKPEYTESDQ